jgi:hypothetical protein
MSEIHDASNQGAGSSEAQATQGLHEDPHRVILKNATWRVPVGRATLVGEPTLKEFKGGAYVRVELKKVLLSQTATLYLLQNATLRHLLGETMVGDLGIFTIVFAEPPKLWKPPPMLPRVIMARIVDRPVDMPLATALAEIFIEESKA